jgi:hypothetical protein
MRTTNCDICLKSKQTHTLTLIDHKNFSFGRANIQNKNELDTLEQRFRNEVFLAGT